MTRLRVAVFLVAASTTLVLAPAASAGLLGLKVSLAPGRTATAPAAGVGAVDVDIVTPVVETHLQVSTAGVSAEVVAPQVSVEASVERKQPKPAIAAVAAPRRPAASSAKSQTTAEPASRPPPVAEEPPAGALARIQTPPLEPASGTPRGSSLSLETAAATPGGSSAALAGVVLLAFLLLSQVLGGPARTLRPPLLSFDLQRPG